MEKFAEAGIDVEMLPNEQMDENENKVEDAAKKPPPPQQSHEAAVAAAAASAAVGTVGTCHNSNRVRVALELHKRSRVGTCLEARLMTVERFPPGPSPRSHPQYSSL